MTAVRAPAESAPVPRPRRRPRLADRELAALLAGAVVSDFGDQLARIAVSVLIYERTRSPAYAALALSASYFPWVLGGSLLAGLGDRYSRRLVLCLSDAFRCVLALLLALPALPSWAVVGLFFLLTCGAPPFASARSAVLPDVTGSERYLRGLGLLHSAFDLGGLLGFGLGGVIVATVGTHSALVIDATTFLVSAAGLRASLNRHYPAPAAEARSSKAGGWRLVIGNSTARWALAVGVVLLAVDAAPLGILVPWAAQLGHGTIVVGLLAAASILGSVVGRFVVQRLASHRRATALLPSGAAGALLLVQFFYVRTLVPSFVLLIVSFVGLSFQILANEMFVTAIPAEARSRAFGVAGSLIYGVQGLSILAMGALASHTRPSTAIAVAGVVGVLLVGVLYLMRPQASPAGQHQRRAIGPEATATSR